MLGWVQHQCPSHPLGDGADVATEREEAEGGMTVIEATGGEDHAGLFLPMRVEGMREVEESEVEARGGKASPGEIAAAAGAVWTQAGWVGGGARGGSASTPVRAAILEGARGSA